MSAQIIPFAEAAEKVKARRRADGAVDLAYAVACCFLPLALTVFAIQGVVEALLLPSGDRS